MSTEILANGIPPDIGSDILNWIGRPKNVIVIARFPETVAMGFLEFKGSALLEDTDKFAEIGTIVDSLREDVNVIRHEAIGMETKRVGGGTIEKEMEGALGVICVREMWITMVTANSDEIGLTAKIVFGG